MYTLQTRRFFFYDMSGINRAIPLVAERLRALFPNRDHGRPITVSVRQPEGAYFPVEKLLSRIKDEMGEKPVTIFDSASWLRSTYPILPNDTVRAILKSEREQVLSLTAFVFLSHDMFPELAQVLGKKSETDHCPVAEVAGVYLSGVFTPQEIVYHPHS